VAAYRLLVNTSTYHVRCFALPGYRFDRDEAEWLAAELVGEEGSYLVPIVVRLSENNTVLDIQTGLCDTFDFWRQFHRCLDSVWVRSYYDGGDLDSIIRMNDDWFSRNCRYGFDEVRVGLEGDADPAAILRTPRRIGWTEVGESTWRLALPGTYVTGNDRSVLCSEGGLSVVGANEPWDGPRLHPGRHMWVADRPVPPTETGIGTPTSPAGLTASAFEEETSPFPVVPEASPALRWVELYWRGRLVRRSTWHRRHRGGNRWWMHACADDWDNCQDLQYLTYLLDRAKLAPVQWS
jgi:hypothetical protein